MVSNIGRVWYISKYWIRFWGTRYDIIQIILADIGAIITDMINIDSRYSW